MANKKIIYDITLPLFSSMTVYPGDPPFQLEKIQSIKKGDPINLSFITMNSHTGTHIDAPSHYLADGLTVDKIPLDYLIGPAKVIEVKNKTSILPDDLEDKEIEEGDRILFKTSNSSLLIKDKFQTKYIYLSPETARILAQKKVKLAGIDYYSVDSFTDEMAESHNILLSNNIVILEGINLSEVHAGEYQLIALPLKISGCDGSPVRAVLVK